MRCKWLVWLLVCVCVWMITGSVVAQEQADLVSYFQTEDLALCPLQPGDTSDAVLRLQFRLGSLGFRTRKSNGIYDEAMKREVSFFQGQNGLEETGTADEATLLKVYRLDAPFAARSPMFYPTSERNAGSFIPAYVFWYFHHEQMEMLCFRGKELAGGDFYLYIHPAAPDQLQLHKPEENSHALPLLADEDFHASLFELFQQQNHFLRQLNYASVENRFEFHVRPLMGGCFVHFVYQPAGFTPDAYGQRLHEEWMLILHGAT